MANEITRLLPYRGYDENDVINFYALDAATGEAGSVVMVSAANLTEEPVSMTTRGDADSYQNVLGNGYSPYPEVNYKVTKVTGTGDANRPLGIMLRDIRANDENGQNLLFDSVKREELQCVVSGQAVPIATKGIFTINAKGLTNGVAPAVNSLAVPAANGTLTGVAWADADQAQKDVAVGKFIATGERAGQSSTDAFEGAYAVIKLEL
jgi:predicted RecA/RadA family phage recombinase